MLGCRTFRGHKKIHNYYLMITISNYDSSFIDLYKRLPKVFLILSRSCNKNLLIYAVPQDNSHHTMYWLDEIKTVHISHSMKLVPVNTLEQNIYGIKIQTGTTSRGFKFSFVHGPAHYVFNCVFNNGSYLTLFDHVVKRRNGTKKIVVILVSKIHLILNVIHKPTDMQIYGAPYGGKPVHQPNLVATLPI